MCEANGINARYPLLDEEIVDLSTRIPVSALLKGQDLRFFFKDSLRDFLPQSTLQKTKHGFGLPFGLWLRNSKDIQNIVYPLLDSFKERGILKSVFIDNLIARHRSDPHWHRYPSGADIDANAARFLQYACEYQSGRHPGSVVPGGG